MTRAHLQITPKSTLSSTMSTMTAKTIHTKVQIMLSHGAIEMIKTFHISSKIALSDIAVYSAMSEREYKEKVKVDDDEVKVEVESKDEFGNKVKEKHEIKSD